MVRCTWPLRTSPHPWHGMCVHLWPRLQRSTATTAQLQNSVTQQSSSQASPGRAERPTSSVPARHQPMQHAEMHARVRGCSLQREAQAAVAHTCARSARRGRAPPRQGAGVRSCPVPDWPCLPACAHVRACHAGAARPDVLRLRTPPAPPRARAAGRRQAHAAAGRARWQRQLRRNVRAAPQRLVCRLCRVDGPCCLACDGRHPHARGLALRV